MDLGPAIRPSSDTTNSPFIRPHCGFVVVWFAFVDAVLAYWFASQ